MFSNNPDIEAALRIGKSEGFLFVINYESIDLKATVRTADIGFQIDKIIDLSTGEHIRFRTIDGKVYIPLEVPIGKTRIFHLLP